MDKVSTSCKAVNSVSDPDSLIPDPDPAFQAEYGPNPDPDPDTGFWALTW